MLCKYRFPRENIAREEEWHFASPREEEYKIRASLFGCREKFHRCCINIDQLEKFTNKTSQMERFQN